MSYSKELTSKIFEYFIKKGYNQLKVDKGTGTEWLTGMCPDCGDERSGKFAINIEDNRSNCWLCGCKDKPLVVVQKLEGLKTFAEVYKTPDAFKGFDYIPSPQKQREQKEKDFQLQLPKEFKLVGIYDDKIAKMVEKNLKSRGFSINKLLNAGVGYCASGDFAMRIIFPYYSKGKLIYFNARSITPSTIKFKNPSVDECGIGKENIIYNIGALYMYKKVWLFESVTNCLTMGSNATGTGGKSLSPWQKSVYLSAPYERIVIGMDDDGYDLALKLAMYLAPFKKVKVLKFPKGKDANNIGRAATMKLDKETPYKTYKEFYKEYLDWQI